MSMSAASVVTTVTVAIIVPVYQEPDVAPVLTRLAAQSADELIVVDGGDAATAEQVWEWMSRQSRDASARLLRAPRGRGAQMNTGAAHARSDVLLFVHADTELPVAAIDLVRQAIVGGARWGRFDITLSGDRRAFRIIEFFMNWRSALTGIATGDQAIFVRRDVFRHVGGFAQMPLMEDIDLSRRLKRMGRPYRVRPRAVTSSRRWERDGVVRTVLTMWALRLAYALGVPPERLVHWYP
jgi:rSAM/selenodomain-associated transferase 2